jgi:hypothetical protein
MIYEGLFNEKKQFRTAYLMKNTSKLPAKTYLAKTAWDPDPKIPHFLHPCRCQIHFHELPIHHETNCLPSQVYSHHVK